MSDTAFEIVRKLRQGVDTNSPPDKTDRLMWEAADKIEMLQEWCRKLIEAGTFPTDPLNLANAECTYPDCHWRDREQAMLRAIRHEAPEGATGTDLVNRLRESHRSITELEAADEIERLRAIIKAVQSALSD